MNISAEVEVLVRYKDMVVCATDNDHSYRQNLIRCGSRIAIIFLENTGRFCALFSVKLYKETTFARRIALMMELFQALLVIV